MKQPSGTHHGAPDWLRGSSRSAFDVVTSDPECYGTPHTGELRPSITPLGRRELIRDGLEQGDWKIAALHLHIAHEHCEHRMVPGITSWRQYVETIPISRTYDHFLRLTITTGSAEAVNTFRQARRLAMQMQAKRPPKAAARGQTLS